MKRRHLLATAITAVGLAGCSSVQDAVSPPPDVPEGMAIETRHRVADVLEEGIWHRRRENKKDSSTHDTTIADRSAARERIADTKTTDGFVEETDFARSYVVIAQNVMQSARWLELGWIERNEDGISMAVTTEEPDEPYGDDATAHTLAVRITDEKAGVPDTTSVVID